MLDPPAVFLEKEMRGRWAMALTGLFQTGTSSFWGSRSRSPEDHASYISGYLEARFLQEQPAAQYQREQEEKAAAKALRARQKAVVRGTPHWLLCGEDWTQNTPEWRSETPQALGHFALHLSPLP